jgi:hypothetical protein
MFVLIAAALAAPLNPWGSATAPGAALLNPYLYVYPEALNPIVYGSAGLSEHADLYFGYGQYIPSVGPSVGTLELMPRFFVVPQLALSPHLYWTPGVDGVTTALEAHTNLSAGPFSFVANVNWKPVIASGGFSAGSVVVLAAPELKLAERFSAYVEVDPTLSLVGDPLTMQVVPGFGMTLDPEARHGISVGLQVPVIPAVGPASLGLWYCFTFPVEAS